MGATHFSGPVIVGAGSVNNLTAATTLTAEDSGTTQLMGSAGGFTITLPALAAGLRFRFVVTEAFATTNWIIASSEGDNISGIIADMGITVAVVVAGAEDQINFVATAETVGDYVDLIADTTNSQWLVSGMCGANGGITATDPA